jgi:hypothetical protein
MIAALRALSEDMPVLVDGYEGGYDEAKTPRVAKVHHRGGDPSEWFLGSYDDHEEGDDEDGFDAVIIGR